MLSMIAQQHTRSAELRAAHRRAYEHAQRCAALPPLSNEEAQRLVAAYLARRPVTICPSPGSYGDGNNLSCGWGGR